MNRFIKGCLFGMAIGDGYGYPAEFLSIEDIISKWSPNGPEEPTGNPILVTDDTQMAIAVAQALMNTLSVTMSRGLMTLKTIEHQA